MMIGTGTVQKAVQSGGTALIQNTEGKVLKVCNIRRCIIRLCVQFLVDNQAERVFRQCHMDEFGAIGGCGALLSKCIKKAEVVAYEDLGAEAIRRLEVEDFPAIVVIDSEGGNLYQTGRAAYLAEN